MRTHLFLTCISASFLLNEGFTIATKHTFKFKLSSVITSTPIPLSSTSTEDQSSVEEHYDDKDNNVDAEVSSQEKQTLQTLFPTLESSLLQLGFMTPTPIQEASADLAMNATNLLLIAPTGSGKSLAYILPALTKAINENGTILIVAPTRELSVQLMRNTVDIVSNLDLSILPPHITTPPSIALAVRGVDMPTPEQLASASILIGTPSELLYVVLNIQEGQGFVAGNVLSAVILDEVDVLLPNDTKEFRTALDKKKKSNSRSRRDNPREERRQKEQQRKLNAAKRNGMDVSKDSNSVMTETDKLLRVIATRRFVGGDDSSPCQVLAGSATASRKTLNRLNRSLRDAAVDASGSMDTVWAGNVIPCRPDQTEGSIKQEQGNDVSGEEEKEPITDNLNIDKNEQSLSLQHTIRAVTVPSQVTHQYVPLEKATATNPTVVLNALAQVVNQINPKTALIFICGEFGKSNIKEKTKTDYKKTTGATNVSRRNTLRKRQKIAVAKLDKIKKDKGTGLEVLSARKACSTLQKYGIDAKPLHVVLGLELHSKDDDYNDDDHDDDENLPYLVTFEGSARGLHFDAVDVVFIIGRPSSAASYLHLAGRVGRASSDENGDIVINPGSVISFCTKGSAKELAKWTQQVGGDMLQEFPLDKNKQ